MENQVRENASEADAIRVKQNPHNLMPRFHGSGDISNYLTLFEKQVRHLNVLKE